MSKKHLNLIVSHFAPFIELMAVIVFMFLFLHNSQLINKNIQKNPEIWKKNIKEFLRFSEMHFQEFDKKSKGNFLFQAVNKKTDLRYYVSAEEFVVLPRSAKEVPWSISYRLKSINQNIVNSKIDQNISKLLTDNKLGLNFNFTEDDYSVHYEHTQVGVRQDFIVGKSHQKQSGLLELILEIQTSLKVVVHDSKILFFDQNNNLISLYEGLKVFDADGRALAAKFSPNDRGILIAVNDQNAVYPIRVDPVATVPVWEYENNQAESSLGYSLAYLGDVNGDGFGDVAVSAPYYDNGQVDEGMVYLFLGSVNGLNSVPAWSYECNRTNCQIGYSLDAAGDVNGDGFKDLIIGAPFYSNGQANEGAVFIFHGSSLGFGANPNRIIESNIAESRFGLSVSGQGKFNNDNFSDVVVGSSHFNGSGFQVGRISLYRGSSSGVRATPTTTIVGTQNEAFFGENVKILADFDGNGYSDLLVSAPMYDNGEKNEGAVFLYKGSSTGLSTTPFWTVESNQSEISFGVMLAAGDINADGKTDFIIGAHRWSGDNGAPYAAGAVFGFLGTDGSLSTNPAFEFFGTTDWEMLGGGITIGDLDGDRFGEVVVSSVTYSENYFDQGRVNIYKATSFDLNNVPMWTKYGAKNEAYFGHQVVVGDVNKDLINDLILSAVYETNDEVYEGKTYVYNGVKSGIGLMAAQEFTFDSQASSAFSATISSAGDVNNDGFEDVLVGAYNFDNGQSNEGRVYLFKGTSAGLSITPAWSYESNQASANFGFSLSKAGDINNDGFDDVVIGAYLYDNGQTNEGRVFIFHGNSTSLSATPNLILEINQAQARFGMAVAHAGDVNADGFSDVLLAAPYFDGTNNDSGRVYLHLGSSSGLNPMPAWMSSGQQRTEYYGFAVSSAGDTNNDGFDDIIIGSPRFDNGQTDEGKIEVFLGNGTTLNSMPNFVYESNTASAQLGYSTAFSPKLNDDVYSDIIVGAPFYRNTVNNEGAAFVFYGSSQGITTNGMWSKFSGQNGANLGKFVANAGDTDNDGFHEIVLGAPLYDSGQNNEGVVFLYNGTLYGVNLSHSWLGEGNVANRQFGTSIAGDLDINGDGFSDLVVGSPNSTTTNTADGKVFIYFGNLK